MNPSDDTPRADAHGEDCSMGANKPEQPQTDERSPLTGRMAVVHCHDCWKYTDDSRTMDNLVHDAVVIICNGGTLDVKNSDEFSAADAFLKSRFQSATPLMAPRY
jgi:hypothetical protein